MSTPCVLLGTSLFFYNIFFADQKKKKKKNVLFYENQYILQLISYFEAYLILKVATPWKLP